jgi:proteic killer suppression protein
MIQSFKCWDTEAMFSGKRIERFTGIQSAGMRKLAILNVTGRIEDLNVPPGNRLEKLKGARQGQWSIRINNQWRICFRFESGNALDVEIVDYH